MSRRISISTVMNFFREASTDEVRAVMPLVFEALGKRKIAVDGTAMQRRSRRLNGAAGSTLHIEQAREAEA